MSNPKTHNELNAWWRARLEELYAADGGFNFRPLSSEEARQKFDVEALAQYLIEHPDQLILQDLEFKRMKSKVHEHIMKESEERYAAKK